MRSVKSTLFLLFAIAAIIFSVVWSSVARERIYSSITSAIDTGELRYPIPDESGVLDNKPNTIDLKSPKNIERRVEYDPKLKQYIITETIGGRFFRSPQYLSFEEYQKYEAQQNKNEYWKQRSSATDLVQNKGIVPKLYVNNQVFDRIFGGGSVDIRPQGSAELIFSGKFNRNENPAFSERAKRTGNFDFDQKIQMNVIGNIGDKLKVITNFNTESQFDFENQVKLDYTGYEDEIIKKIEAGNVSLPLSGSLITGSQSLFGIKTQLQFGRLTMTSVFSQQKSEPKEINITSGAQTSNFRFSADSYEANKHYFLSDYFKDNYEAAFVNPPFIQSQIAINLVEVFITNETNKFDDARNVIAFIDLGEDTVFNKNQVQGGLNRLPNSRRDTINLDNGSTYVVQPSNNLIDNLPPNVRQSKDNTIDSYFNGNGANDNFSKLTNARKLTSREFTFNPTLGYISLSRSLNAAEVLSVAFRYTINGVEYQVGEFSTDRPLDPLKPDVLYTKLLKNATLKTNLPTWDLMMKNIYPLNAFQINEKNFRLNVVRLDESTGIERQVITEGMKTSGQQFIQLLNVDRLNTQQAARPDGIFDFIDNVTIDRANGRIIFPVREPFGSNLKNKFDPSETKLIEKYVFQQLYDTTKNAAQQFPEVNKYFIIGSYQSTSSSEFSLNAFNIPQGSVVVTAGNTILTEGSQYTVDYNVGKVKIIDESYLNSAIPIKIKLEAQQLFPQQKTFLGTRFDYKYSQNLNLGGTVLRLSERPITQKVNIGEEPISNTMYGLDGNYRSDSRFLTNLVDRLPFIETKETSSITLNSEYAYLQPGHSRALNTPGNRDGISYIDDFEASLSIIDLRNPQQWSLSSTPQLFPESNTFQLDNGFNRAQLSWYNIDQLFFQKNNSATPRNIRDDKNQLSNHYLRQVLEQQVFPNRQTESGQANILTTFDLSYFPNKRGPYNYTTTNLNTNGDLLNPASRWGGIYRGITSTDFEALNVEFIEFWVMDPFYYDQNARGGDLYFNLGSISEDVLKDGRKSVENGLPINGDNFGVDTTVFGRVPSIEPVTQTFDNEANSRKNQDVGFDGLSTENEKTFFANYLQTLSTVLAPGSPGLIEAQNDPSNDDNIYFRGTKLDDDKADLLTRYSKINNTEGNSKTSDQSRADFGVEVGATTLIPDAEDANRDNNISKEDEYFQYKISMRPQDLVIGQNYITDEVLSTVKLENGKTESIKWFQFKIPVIEGTPIGGIQDFKTIRFIRMFVTNFSDTTTLRFARLQLNRGEWRKYLPLPGRPLRVPDDYIGEVDDNTSLFDVSIVNVEENASRKPIPYVLPPGIAQELNASSIRGNIRQNEQSLVLRVKDLRDGYARATHKNTDFDFRAYKRIEMFIHAEGNQIKDGDVTTFIRFGTDFTANYYEYEIPMQITPNGANTEDPIWPNSNKLDISLSVLQNAKQERNNANASLLKEYYFQDGNNRVTVVGSPDLSRVRSIMIGVRNPKRRAATQNFDDGENVSAEIWVNELRLTDFDQDGGWAATARATAKLADFGTVTVAGSRSTPGFGSIDKKVGERSRSDDTQLDISTTAEIGKFFPESTGLKIPVFYNYSQIISKPEYSPSAPDILLTDLINQSTGERRDTLRKLTIDKTVRKSINFTNVRKEKTKPNAKTRLYDVENLNASYTYTHDLRTNYDIEKDLTVNHRGTLGYNYAITPKNVRPFDKFIKSKNLNLIKDFNFNYLPNLLAFRVDVDRLYEENQLRNLDPNYIPPSDISSITYNKYFRITRFYSFRYDITRALKVDFTAQNLSNVDEPDGRIETASQRDTILNNLKKFGRTTDYDHNFNVTYAVPITKLPFLDWTKLDVRYGGRFQWQSKPLVQIERTGTDSTDFGNIIQNSRSIQVNPTFSLTTLYNRSKFLKQLNTPKRPVQRPPSKKPVKDERGLDVKSLEKLASKKKSAKDSLEKVKKPPNQSFLKLGARLLTSVKIVSGTYSRTDATVLPGYLPQTGLVGYDFNQNAPGIPFLLGSQKNITAEAGAKGWITRDENLTNRYVTGYREDINLRATLEPLPEFRIELTAIRNFALNKTSNFRFVNDTIQNFTGFRDLAPIETGSLSISIITIRSAFGKEKEPNFTSEYFKEFERNRIIIAQRLSEGNVFSNGQIDSGFYDGYGGGSQEVLINAFLAAYTGTDPKKQKLDLFTKIPLPNWQVNYTGLSKLPFLTDIFSTIGIRTSYRSSYSLLEFKNLLQFDKTTSSPSARDAVGNFLPEFQVSQVGIREDFAPLLGVDVKLRNNMTLNIGYTKSRSVSLNLGNSQVNQVRDDGIVFGFGYITNNFKIPFKINGKITELKNNMTFRMDFSIRNSISVYYRIGVEQTTPYGGNRILGLNPSIDYVVNERFNVRAFYDYRLTKPKSSISYLTAFTQAGVSVRFTLGN